MDPKLKVPRVQKFVNKVTILKSIVERNKSSQARSGTPSGSPRYPVRFNRCLSRMPLLRLLIFRVFQSPLLITLWRRMLGMAFLPRCNLFTVLLFFQIYPHFVIWTLFILFAFLGYFVLLGLLFCYDTMPPILLVLCILIILQMNVWLNCYVGQILFFFKWGTPDTVTSIQHQAPASLHRSVNLVHALLGNHGGFLTNW